MDFEQVHNFYERPVFETVAQRAVQHPDFTSAMLADVACVALNQLPARYVQHDADMMFYLGSQERQDSSIALAEAVEYAFGFVGKRST